MERPSGRRPNEMRPITFERGYISSAEGSVLTVFGGTRVLCTATIEPSVPPFLRNTGRGWVKAEYGMLPRATQERTRREAVSGGQGGRTQEIQRLIGRALRAAVDLDALGPNTIIVDCDVIQADGGTRTASITGGCLALADALTELKRRELAMGEPWRGLVTAVSVGMWQGQPLLDMDYAEDSTAESDLNVAVDQAGKFIEIQGTAEGAPISGEALQVMLELARAGAAELADAQRRALDDGGGK